MYTLTEFLNYANAGEVPASYSKKRTAKKPASTSARPKAIQAKQTAFLAPAKTQQPTPTPAPTVSTPPANVNADDIRIVMYSDRSFAVFGETKPKKDLLRSLYGTFNPYLKENGIVTPGYIFSIKRLSKVKVALNL